MVGLRGADALGCYRPAPSTSNERGAAHARAAPRGAPSAPCDRPRVAAAFTRAMRVPPSRTSTAWPSGPGTASISRSTSRGDPRAPRSAPAGSRSSTAHNGREVPTALPARKSVLWKGHDAQASMVPGGGSGGGPPADPPPHWSRVGWWRGRSGDGALVSVRRAGEERSGWCGRRARRQDHPEAREDRAERGLRSAPARSSTSRKASWFLLICCAHAGIPEPLAGIPEPT